MLLPIHVHPVAARFFEMLHTPFQNFLIPNQLLHLKCVSFRGRVLARKLFKHLQALTKILVFILQLKYLTVLLVN